MFKFQISIYLYAGNLDGDSLLPGKHHDDSNVEPLVTWW